MCAFAYLLQLKYLVTIEMFFLLLLLFCCVFVHLAQPLSAIFFCYFCVAVLSFFIIISFDLIYSFFCIKSTIKMVVVSLLWNLGCSEGIYDFYPQSFAS